MCVCVSVSLPACPAFMTLTTHSQPLQTDEDRYIVATTSMAELKAEVLQLRASGIDATTSMHQFERHSQVCEEFAFRACLYVYICVRKCVSVCVCVCVCVFVCVC
jgi:hypothetical protein